MKKVFKYFILIISVCTVLTACGGGGGDESGSGSGSGGSSPSPVTATYTVTYDGNGNTGGSAPTDTKTYAQGDWVTVLGVGTLTKTNYNFGGWLYNGNTYAPGATFQMGSANVTLTAVWSQNTYTVTYDGNGANGAPPTDPMHYANGDIVTVLGVGTLTKTGYTFGGWLYNGSTYAPGAIFQMGSASVTLTAVWNQKPYTVTYDGNGNTGGSSPTDPMHYDNGDIVTVLGVGTLTKTGYTFGGWLYNGSTYAPGATFQIGSASVTLTVVWNQKPYTVTYDGNGNTGGSSPTDPMHYDNGDIVTALGVGTLTKTTFSFVGWNTQANGSGTTYTQGQTFPMGTSNVTLYAIWRYNSTVTVTTFAGTALTPGSHDGTGTAATFHYPYGITTDGTNIYVADTGNATIRKIVIKTGVVSTIAGSAGVPGSHDGTGMAATFYGPTGITTDGTNIYVADTSNCTIRKIVIKTGVVSTIAGTVGVQGSQDDTGTAATFHYPYGITTDGTNIYVADTFNYTIRKIVIKTGVVSTIAGSAGVPGSHDGTGTAATFYGPYGITTDGTNIYVADTSNCTIRKIVIATGVVSTIAGTAGVPGSHDGTGTAATFYGPTGITTDGTNLYVASNDYTIRKVVIAARAVTTIAGSAGAYGSADGQGTAATFNLPWSITADGTILYVADTLNFTIRKLLQ